MIDRIVCATGKDLFADDYNAGMAVQGYELYNPDSDKLAVVFPQWHDDGRLTNRLYERLQKRGWAVLGYRLNDQILEPSIDRVPQSYEVIKEEVITGLDALQSEAAYRYVHMIGISLGTMAMSLVASEYPGFSSATFVIPCSKLASSMWEGGRTQGIKRNLENQGYSKRDVEDAWIDLEPMSYAGAFSGKTVQNHISKNDRIILPKYQYEMRDALNSSGSYVSNSYTRRGHASSIINFCMFSGRI